MHLLLLLTLHETPKTNTDLGSRACDDQDRVAGLLRMIADRWGERRSRIDFLCFFVFFFKTPQQVEIGKKVWCLGGEFWGESAGEKCSFRATFELIKNF